MLRKNVRWPQFCFHLVSNSVKWTVHTGLSPISGYLSLLGVTFGSCLVFLKRYFTSSSASSLTSEAEEIVKNRRIGATTSVRRILYTDGCLESIQFLKCCRLNQIGMRLNVKPLSRYLKWIGVNGMTDEWIV